MNSKHISLDEFIKNDNEATEDYLQNKACISITDICQKSIDISPYWGSSLSLKFYDTDIKDHPQSFTIEQAKQVIDYMLLINNKMYDQLVIHCHAGISRSAALHNFFQYYIVNNPYIINNPPQFIGNSYVYSTLVNTYLEFYQDIK